MKNTKKWIALLLALVMVLSLAACGGDDTPTTNAPGTSAPPATTGPSTDNPDTGKYVIGEHIQPEALGSGTVKWSETTTADGWVEVTNEGGATLGYSPNSGVSLIQVDGYAFKDLDRDGQLDVYEDWRVDSQTRAIDLAAHMSGEEIAPYLTHGGWGTFTTDKATFASESNSGYAYITGGGRAGVTRSAGSTTEANVDHAIWANLIQELCESLDYGIPGLISIDPNGQSGMIASQSLAATFDPAVALEVGKAYSEQYRAMGISVLLGPQVDLMTTPVLSRGNGTYTEDPALNRDITEAYVSGMQSTWAEDGTDLGWGTDSVMTVMKHYAGAGASQDGYNDHSGKYTVFPNNNFEAHIIAFHDGAFDLTNSSTGAAGGVMMNYSVSYSTDGSLGELVAGAFSQFKYDTLFTNWSGLIVSDWGPISGGSGVWGMEDYTSAERAAITIELGMTQMGGFNDLSAMAEAWEIVCEDVGEEAALEMFRDRAYENILVTMELGLFENPYCSTERVRELNCTEDARAYGLETQLKSVIMLKNDGTIKEATDGEKQTAYIPYYLAPATTGKNPAPATWTPSVNLEVAAKYYNVVTDTVGEPSGVDADGNPVYTADDIIRPSASEIAACDVVLVGMTAPKTDGSQVTDDEGVTTYLPPSIQYSAYTATTAKEVSIAGDLITTTFNDGYTMQTVVEKENRSYKDQTTPQASNYSQLEALQYAAGAAGKVPVVVLMTQSNGAMVWSEVEPLADAILTGYASVSAEALVMTAAGLNEPNGLLVVQMPASMEAVEAQTGEDMPRDLECYVDANGNTYDFAFGMNWSGVINDERVQTYNVAPLTECENIDFQYAN